MNSIGSRKWQPTLELCRAEASRGRKPCGEAWSRGGTALIGPHTADGSMCVLEVMCAGMLMSSMSAGMCLT